MWFLGAPWDFIQRGLAPSFTCTLMTFALSLIFLSLPPNYNSATHTARSQIFSESQTRRSLPSSWTRGVGPILSPTKKRRCPEATSRASRSLTVRVVIIFLSLKLPTRHVDHVCSGVFSCVSTRHPPSPSGRATLSFLVSSLCHRCCRHYHNFAVCRSQLTTPHFTPLYPIDPH